MLELTPLPLSALRNMCTAPIAYKHNKQVYVVIGTVSDQNFCNLVVIVFKGMIQWSFAGSIRWVHADIPCEKLSHNRCIP